MNNELFEPSLQNETHIPMESYNMGKLFYVAFFAGIVPLTVLSFNNAKKLKVDPKWVKIIMFLGVALLLAKAIFIGFYASGSINMEKRTVRWIFRIATVLLYLFFKYLMTPNYNKFILNGGGECQPILKDALIWFCIGVGVEFSLLSLLVGLVMKLG